MKRKIFGALVATVLVLSFSLATAVPVAAAVINVPADYPTIQAAIDAATAGDTINVAAGTYDLTAPIAVNKALTLIGDTAHPENVVVNAGGIAGDDRDCFQVMHDNVTIQGFKMINATTGTLWNPGCLNGGIMVGNWGDGMWDTGNDPVLSQLANLSGFDFSYNIFDTCSYGIYFFACSDAVICHNTFTNIYPSAAGFDGPCVLLYDTGYGPPGYAQNQYLIDSVTVSHNIMSGCKDGISLGTENYSGGQAGTISNVTVADNDISGCTGVGTGFFSYRYDDTVLPPIWTNINVNCNNITGSNWGVSIGGLKGSGWDTPDGFSLGGIHVNYNNISGNTMGFNVWTDSGMTTVDATMNWWGDASGPTHSGNPGGTGDAVSDNVDYDPWLTAAVAGAKTGESPPTVGPTDVIDAEVEVLGGTGTLTVAQYEDNPGTGFSGDIGKYIDVHIVDPGTITELEIRLYYTDDEIEGLAESSLRLYWWDGEDWVECSDSGVNPEDINDYSGYIWARIRDDTTPSLDDLTGTPFGGSGSPRAVGGTVYPVNKVSILMPWIGLALALALAGVFGTRLVRSRVRG